MDARRSRLSEKPVNIRNTAQNSAKQAGFCSCKTSISAILGGQGKRHPTGDKVPKEGKGTKITNTVSPRPRLLNQRLKKH
jgi:hypothetical protein